MSEASVARTHKLVRHISEPEAAVNGGVERELTYGGAVAARLM